MQMQLTDRYRKDPSVVFRQVAGETILVPIHGNASDVGSIYTLNESAARTWELLDGQRTLAEVHQVMVSEYEVEEDEAREDLFELVSGLMAVGALELDATRPAGKG